ncbi:50S ribosomal protein L22 [Candidatus Woesearchaeota archaeon]|nr:50S ribosomal protein L22 [Candidatus Woesearchaeota archaeon]
MQYRYSTKTENAAKAVAKAAPVSTKHAMETCNLIRGQNLAKAKQTLQDVIELKHAVPLKHHNQAVAHKHGMAAGRYPVTVCKHLLAVLESAEANAQFKGMGANLIVKHASAQTGPTTKRYGRHIGREAKCTHLEVVLAEAQA